jgi:hypothetical protein
VDRRAHRLTHGTTDIVDRLEVRGPDGVRRQPPVFTSTLP